MREISVDLPAFGKPTSPTSASSFRWRRRSFSSPGSPGCVLRGARLVEVANCALPQPPCPPLAMRTRSPSSVRSATWPSLPVLDALVHDRTDRHVQRHVVSALAGAVRALRRWRRCSAANVFWNRKFRSVFRLALATMKTEPPLPAVAAVRPAARDELLAAKAHRAARRRGPPSTWTSTSSTNETWRIGSRQSGSRRRESAVSDVGRGVAIRGRRGGSSAAADVVQQVSRAQLAGTSTGRGTAELRRAGGR